MTDTTKNCPECNESLENRDPKKHALRHWGFEPVLHKGISDEGLKRARQLDSKFAIKGGSN